MDDLAQRLAEKLAGEGWTVRRKADGIEAETLAIAAKWWLGSRRVRHQLHLDLDAAARQVTLKETATETVIGLPPPAFSVATTKQRGLAVGERREDAGFGGGVLRYGELRPWLEQECASAGWTLKLQIGTG